MSVRRLISVLSVCLVATITTSVVAQPAGAPAPAKDPPADGAPPPADGEGSAVQMVEDPPPDMDGVDENPDAPRTVGGTSVKAAAIPEKQKSAGYPIEEALRPITLPQNMSEISLAPHAQISPYAGSDALRARYGITRQVQLGLTYVLGGIYDDPGTVMSDKIGFHPGKAVGLDVTVLLQDWLAVRMGVPVYIDPVAVGLQLGAPMRFYLSDKLTVGGLEDLVTVTINKFPPSLYQEAANAQGAANDDNNTTQSRGALRFNGFAIYQYRERVALIGRVGIMLDDFSSTRNNAGYGGVFTSIRAGFQYTPRKYLDVGASLGFDDLSKAGSFAPAGFLALRI